MKIKTITHIMYIYDIHNNTKLFFYIFECIIDAYATYTNGENW